MCWSVDKSVIKGRLQAVKKFVCKTCITTRIVPSNLFREKVLIDGGESITDFCYLGNAADRCVDPVTACIHFVWKSYHKLLLMFHFYFRKRGKFLKSVPELFSSMMVRHGHYHMTILIADNAMIRWLFGVK